MLTHETGRPWPDGSQAGTGPAGGVWIEIPQPDPVIDDVVWHYTDSAGLIGIMETQRLHAASATTLNDSSEIGYGIGVLNDCCEAFLRRADVDDSQRAFISAAVGHVSSTLTGNEIVVACASLAENDLGQWRGYAGSTGFAIGLDPVRALAADGSESGEQPLLAKELSPTWRKVIYEPDEQRERLCDVLNRLSYFAPADATQVADLEVETWNPFQATVLALSTFVVSMKDHAFRQEREVRFVMDATRLRKCFRSGRFGVTPYIPLVGNDNEPWSGLVVAAIANPSTLPITEICVGPGLNQETALQGAISLAAQHGLPKTAVWPSQTPYR